MKYPERETAQRLEKHGRYGDSILVHMAPEELQGIAALAPDRSITINPQTGLPEAFKFKDLLKFGLPMAAAAFAPALLPALPAALAGGIGSGVATTALTGDLKRGLLSGVMGAGLGAASGAAAKAGTEAAATAAAEAATLGPEAIAQKAIDSTILGGGEAAIGSVGQAFSPPLANPALLPNPAGMSSMVNAATPLPDMSLGERAMAPFQKGSGFAGELLKPRTMLPMALGAGQMAEMDAADANAKSLEDFEKERKEDRRRAYQNLQAAYRAAQPGASPGLSPARSMMSSNMPIPGYAEGGKIEFEGGDMPYMAGKRGNPGYQGIDPVTIQQRLRGAHPVRPPPEFIPGFNPEFDYFQNDPENIQVPPITGPADWSRMYAGFPSSRVRRPAGSYFESILQQQQPVGMAEGGSVPLNTPAGQVGVSPGGIAGIETPYTQAPEQPQEQDLQMVAMAILGRSEQPDQIIEMFISKYGVDTFRQVREMVLQSTTPNAQTEGLISGPGGGMDDQVPGMIGDQQPVAVSSGEYVVPADVVSGLGDGSSESGAQQLDAMANGVRMARGGQVNQPPPIDPSRMMPR